MRDALDLLLRATGLPNPDRAEDLWAEYRSAGPGAHTAFATLMAWHGGAIYRRIWGFVRSDAADDVFQDVLVKLHRQRARLATFADALRWLRTVATTASVDAHRRDVRRRARERVRVTTAATPPPGDPPWELAEALRAALASLSGREREAVALVFFEGKTRQDAAAALGVHRDTFAKLLDGALARLRASLSAAAVVGTAATAATLDAALPVRAISPRLADLVAAAWQATTPPARTATVWWLAGKKQLLAGVAVGGLVAVSVALSRSPDVPTTMPRKTAARLGVERLETRDNPSGGLLDPTFGVGGRVTLPFDGGVPAIAAQPDGKTLTLTGNKVVRLNANGSTDTSFGGNGTVTLSGMGGQAVALQPDGKILVGGSVYARVTRWSASDAQYAVARLNPNGTLDTTFGNNRGYWLANPTTRDEMLNEVAAVPAGNSFSIYVGGAAPQADGSYAFAAVRLTPAGLPDPTFGTGGFVTRKVGIGLATTHNDLVVLPNGRVVLSGIVRTTATTGASVLVAFTPAGQTEAGFGTGGVTYVSVPGATRTLVSGLGGSGLTVQGSSLLVSGSTAWPDRFTRGVLMRYTPEGTLDTAFGTDGIYLGPGGTAAFNTTLFMDVRVAADGTLGVVGQTTRMDAAGVTSPGVLIGRLSADGVPDAGFGPAPDGTGLVAHYNLIPRNSIGAWPSYSHQLTLDADGNLLMGATTPPYSTSVGARPVVVRFTAR